MSSFDCRPPCKHNNLAVLLMTNHGFVSADYEQIFNEEQKAQARDNIGAASKADIPDISGLATKAELSNLQLGLTEEQVRAIIEEYHPPKPKDQGLAKDYSGSGWYKATDTGIVYNKGVPEGETHIFEGDPIEYVSYSTFEDILPNAERAATSNFNDVFGYVRGGMGPEWNERVTHWDTSSFAGFQNTFSGLLNFDQNISHWDVSNAEFMGDMLSDTPAFDHDLSQWCVAKIPEAPSSFADGSALSPEHYPSWGTCPRGEDQA